MIDVLTWFIVALILGVYSTSIYAFFKDKKTMEAKRKRHMDKFNK
tara:strand:+ start:301 stop:435 length:135 start_codon:yes stop_codon:yes gene_type:complete